MNTIEIIKQDLLNKENSLSKYATKSSEGVRLHPQEEDVRPAYFHDTDSILHSASYSRYIDKTQGE